MLAAENGTGFAARFKQLLERERLVYTQKREIEKLRTEVEALRLQNDKINRAMRRCLTCDYRLDAISETREAADCR